MSEIEQDTVQMKILERRIKRTIEVEILVAKKASISGLVQEVAREAEEIVKKIRKEEIDKQEGFILYLSLKDELSELERIASDPEISYHSFSWIKFLKYRKEKKAVTIEIGEISLPYSFTFYGHLAPFYSPPSNGFIITLAGNGKAFRNPMATDGNAAFLDLVTSFSILTGEQVYLFPTSEESFLEKLSRGLRAASLTKIWVAVNDEHNWDEESSSMNQYYSEMARGVKRLSEGSRLFFISGARGVPAGLGSKLRPLNYIPPPLGMAISKWLILTEKESDQS